MEFVIATLLLFEFAQSTIFNATSSSIDLEIYDTSSTNLFNYPAFSNPEIVCSKINCQIICDVVSGCRYLTINASLSDTLTLQCTNVSSCYQLIISAAPRLTANIDCTDKNACYYPEFNLDSTVNVSLNCNYSEITTLSDSPCRSVTLRATNSENVYIDSVTKYASYHSDYYGSFVTNTFNVNCNDEKSCYGVNILCPQNTTTKCNIFCNNETQRSCQRVWANIFREQLLTNDLNLQCNNNDSGSCYDAAIICLSYGTNNYRNPSSSLVYNINTLKWECSTYGCCPNGMDGNIPLLCNATSPLCTVYCSSNSCKNSIINGSMTNSLKVLCGNCDGTKIICPTSDNSSCSVICAGSYVCQYAIIEAKANYMNQLNIYCGYLYSCDYIKIDLDVIHLNTFNLNCQYGRSCQYPLILAKFQTLKMLNWSFGYGSYDVCDPYSDACSGFGGLYFSENMVSIDTFNLYCDNGCQRMDFPFTTAMITDVTIQCYSNGQSAGYLTNFDFSVINSIQVTCDGLYSCQNTTIKINSLSNTTTSSISCAGGDHVCQHIQIHGPTGTTLDVICDGLESCEEANIMATNTKSLNLDCPGANAEKYGCYHMSVYCPYHEPYACNISCVNNNPNNFGLCTMDIFVNDDFVINYLHLECVGYDTCSPVTFRCDADGSANRTSTNVYYPNSNGQVDRVFCANLPKTQYPTSCCPWTLAPTKSPTYVPTASPTTPPTTAIPTTSLPTAIPTTGSPTTPPTTAIPTAIPTTAIPTTPPTIATPTTAIPTTNAMSTTAISTNTMSTSDISTTGTSSTATSGNTATLMSTTDASTTDASTTSGSPATSMSTTGRSMTNISTTSSSSSTITATTISTTQQETTVTLVQKSTVYTVDKGNVFTVQIKHYLLVFIFCLFHFY